MCVVCECRSLGHFVRFSCFGLELTLGKKSESEGFRRAWWQLFLVGFVHIIQIGHLRTIANITRHNTSNGMKSVC